MGREASITADKFPIQGDKVGKKVSVIYDYDASNRSPGVCVRDDMEAPWLTILALENGRYLLATECQYGMVS